MASIPGSGSGSPSDTNARVRGANLAAREAERVANERIAQARKAQESAVAEGEGRVSEIKDEYVQRSEAESVRQENTYSAQRNKANDQLRDLKRAQEAELARVKREGDRELERMQGYYSDTIYRTERSGDEKLRDLERVQHLNESFARKNGGEDLSAEERTHLDRVNQLRERKEAEYAELTEKHRAEYEELRGQTELKSTQAAEHFDENFNALRAQHESNLGNLGAKASEQLKNVRQDTAAKLGAYTDRQRDPFYKLMEIGAELNDHGSYYELTATVPTHEQKHVSVSVRGNQIVLSGQRRNEEKLELSPGRTQTTNAYQSYSESFPLESPVEARDLRKLFDGDRLSVTVPKKQGFSATASASASKKQVARTRAERPDFPKNLPAGSVPAEIDFEPGVPRLSQKTKGSGTIA